jgi:hypothetical protein
MSAKKQKPDLQIYEALIARRRELRGRLEPDNLSSERAERIRLMADAMLEGKDPPDLYEPRARTELLLDATQHALSQIIGRVGEGVAEAHGREYDSLGVRIDPAAAAGIPESGEALVTLFENACELAERREETTAKRAGQRARYSAALEAYCNAKFKHEREGDEPVVASEKAIKEIDDPAGLWCVEGQAGAPQLWGHEMGRGVLDTRTGELAVD